MAEITASAADDATQTPLEKKEGWWHPVGGLVEEVEPSEAPPPPPEKLASTTRSRFHEVLPFETFALSDEGATVKLYFGLKDAKTRLPPDGVVATFRVQALEVVAKVSPTRTYRCHESILYEHVVPEKCKVKIKTDHVLIIMPKVYQHASWSQLGVNRKAIGPVRKSPPDFGTPTVVKAGGTAKCWEEAEETVPAESS